MPRSSDVACDSGRTSGWAKSGSLPMGCPALPCPSTWRIRRLQKLERRYMGEVEGGSRKWLMRILRHEAGHAIDTAYGLRRRADWRRVFGPSSQPYPGDYAPRPSSRNHVLHLGHWYAQSHPTEDFAETFAVWLQPKARWRRDYADWPALRKLEYVDRLMAEIAGRPPANRDRTVVEPLTTNERTLAKHYRRKAGSYLRYDRRLRSLAAPRVRRPRLAREAGIGSDLHSRNRAAASAIAGSTFATPPLPGRLCNRDHCPPRARTRPRAQASTTRKQAPRRAAARARRA